MNRLIDLHTDWILQYARETTVFDPSLYPRVAGRLGQAEGYLQATRAAILSCYRNVDDWASQADPWKALAEQITRIEAEFPGRLLAEPDDLVRWRDDAEGLAWGVIGVEGFDALVRTSPDLDRLGPLFRRGVRLFQPVYTSTSLLAGSSAAGDDRGLTDLGRAFLERVASLANSSSGPRPILDLAHLNPRSCSDALEWFESNSHHLERTFLIYSHGCPEHEGFRHTRALTFENLRRLRALGGFIGIGVTPPFFNDPEHIRGAIELVAETPFLGRAGYEGIGIGTDFLGVDEVLPDMRNASEVVAWMESSFEGGAASALSGGNAERFLSRVIGDRDPGVG